jgi:hypothetical protein
MPSNESFVFCEACGTINDHVADLVEELDVAKDEVIKKGRRIKQLQKERAGALEADLFYGEATAVLEHWRDVCAPNAREPLSPVRVKPVLDRMHGGYDRVELIKAADGYARFPYYCKGRRCAVGVDLDRSVEAEFIFRNAANVDRGLAMFLAPTGAGTQPSPAFVARVPWDAVWRENRRLICAALTRRFGGSIDSGYTDGRKWPCPVCQHEHADPPGMEPSTLFVSAHVGHQIARCNVCGVTDAKLLAAITDVA